MEWMRDPQWWAVAAALLGCVINGIFNVLNWVRSAKPKYSFAVECPDGMLSPELVRLRNTGEKKVTGLWLEPTTEIDFTDADDEPFPRIPKESPTFLEPNRFLTFVGRIFQDGRYLLPNTVTVHCDQSKDPFIVEVP